MTRTKSELAVIAQDLPVVSHLLLAYLYAWERKMWCELGPLQEGVQPLYDAGLAQRDGHHVEITADGHDFVERVRPVAIPVP